MSPFKSISALLILLLGIGTLHAQPSEWKSLYGKWKVEKWIMLDTSFFSASEEGRKEAMEEQTECMTGTFTFSSDGIAIDKEVCDFENCGNQDKAIAYKHVRANFSTTYIHDLPGDELEEDNVIGAAFLKLISLPNAKMMSYIQMECDNEEMEGTDVYVCLIARNRVALYFDDNLLLLKRVR